MKIFDQLTQDQQMDALDGAKYDLTIALFKDEVIINLVPYDQDIRTAIDTLRQPYSEVGLLPDDFIRYLDQVPRLKIAFLHEAGRMVKRATYPG